MTVNIPNFCRSHSLHLTTQMMPAAYREPLVVLYNHDGPCSFTHSMTADQARQMAAALIAAANTIEIEKARAANS